MSKYPSIDEVRAALDYNPATGEFRWKDGHRKNGCKSDRAGSVDAELGYRAITINGVKVREHILAWMHFYGREPKSQIDHRNGKRDENWIDNLRESGALGNNQNQERQVGASGFRNVTMNAYGRWYVRLKVNKKPIQIGTFDCLELAAHVAAEARDKYFGEFAIDKRTDQNV
jgi:hypothetical protein